MLFYFLTKQWSYIINFLHRNGALFVYENEKRMDKGQSTNQVLLSNTSLWNLPIFYDDTCDKLTKQFLLEVWYTVEKTASRQETTGKFFSPKVSLHLFSVCSDVVEAGNGNPAKHHILQNTHRAVCDFTQVKSVLFLFLRTKVSNMNKCD